MNRPLSQQSSYRQIFKATSLFGGVQVFQILIGLVRVKFVAVLLGPTGVGIMGLLNAPLDLIKTISGLGIRFSAVKDVAEAHGEGDEIKISKTIQVLRRWSWLTGIVGALATIALSPWLSQWTFGNREYTFSFIWLSVTILFYALSGGQSAILQGTQRLRHLAKSSVWGSFLGLFTSIPLYYFYGIEGIVPALIISGATTLFLTWYFSSFVKIVDVRVTVPETLQLGAGMIKLGAAMSLTGLLGALSSYLLIAFISRIEGPDYAGLYNAGWSIIGQYTGMVFTALTVDYYPRLAASNQNRKELGQIVTRQGEMVQLILGPFMALLVISAPLLIRILYTPEFLPVVNFIIWASLGVVLKGVSWSIGFIFPATGNVRLFAGIEIFSIVLFFAANVAFFYFFRLAGLGVAYVLDHFLAIGIYFYFARKHYDFQLSAVFWRMLSFNIIGVGLIIFLQAFGDGLLFDLISIIVFLSITTVSLAGLNRRMDVLGFVKSKLKRNNHQ